MPNKSNELRTTFVFDDAQIKKVDALKSSLLEVNNAFNNLGGSTVLGKTVDANATLAGQAVDKLKTKVTNSKAQIDAEFKQLTSDIGKSLSIDLKKPNDKLLKDAQADIKRMQAETIAGEKAITRSIEREAKLQADTKIREQRRAANDFLSSLKNVDKIPGGAPAPADLRLSSFQKTNLAYQANDVVTMAALGADPTRILASQGGQIAQTFSAEQIAAFTEKYAALIPILGLGTAALALTYKITGDIRDAAERRLKTEEKITSILNKQRLEAQELTNEFNKQRREADEARRIRYYQEDTPTAQVRGRRDLLDKLLAMRANDATKEGAASLALLRNEFNLLDEQLKDFDRKRQLADRNSPDAAFDQRKVDYKRNAELERQSIERQQIEAAERFKRSVEEGREKVKELGKTFTDTFDNLYQKTGASNPFAAIFSEADKSLKSLRENIRGLSPDLQAQALAMQATLNSNALFSARLDNALAANDLREGAAGFRNFREQPKTPDIKDPKQFFKDFTEFYANEIEKKTGGSFLGYAKNGSFGGTTSYDLRDGLNFAFDRVAGGGTLRRQRNFNDLSALEKQNYLSSINQVDSNQNLSLQNRLDKQFAIVNSLGAQNPEQAAIANRKIISLTQGVDPSQLTQSQREQAALAREREAVRLENAEREAAKQRDEQIKLQKRIADNQEALLKIVNEKGLAGLNQMLEIQVTDKTNGGAGGGVNVLGATPKPNDMLSKVFGGFDD